MAYVCVKYECRAPAATTSASLAQMYDTTLEQIAWIDALGLPVTINFCEHHGADDNYLPSPLVLAAAAARLTRHVRLQVNVLLPYLDPLRVAEDVAVLDHLSHGRAEVLLLGGYVASELAMFGVDPRERGSLMDEGVRALKAAWSGEPFTYRGRPARIFPRPLQQPHPPIFMGGSAAPAARRAAREADAFIGGMPHLNEIYVNECQALGRQPRFQGELPMGFLYVSEEPERDWARLAPFCLYETNCYARWQQSSSVDMLFGSAVSADELKKLGTYQVLRPEDVLARARTMAPHDAVMLHPLVGGLDADLSWEMLRNFFGKVAPRLSINGI